MNRERDTAEDLPRSRIPIKSPARSIGGMTIAYSPKQKCSSSPCSVNENTNNNNNNNINSKEEQQHRNSIDNYSKKLEDLRRAMELLKTPPPVSKPFANINTNTTTNMNMNMNTKINSSFSLNSNSNLHFPSNSSFISAASSDDLQSEMAAEINDIMSRIADNETDESFIEEDNSCADHEGENDENLSFSSSYYYSSHSKSNAARFNHRAESKEQEKEKQHLNSPFTSPCSSISTEEFRERLAATKEAFQKSLQSQNDRRSTVSSGSLVKSSSRLCGVPVGFDDIDSLGFESDLSTDSFMETKKELEDINNQARKLLMTTPFSNPLDPNQESKSIQNSKTSASIRIRVAIIISLFVLAFSLLLFHVSVPSSNNLRLEFEFEPFLQKCEQIVNFWLQDDQEGHQILIQ